MWNFAPELPLRSAPFLHWPPRPVAIAKHLGRTWLPLRSRFFMLATSFLIWAWFMPSAERTKHFELGWILEVWLRNLILVTVVAGGLHVWLYVIARQGDGLRYDARPFGRNKRVFLFGNQVRENIFLTLVPAVGVWTGFEALLLWAYANGYAPSITFGDNPAWFVVFLAIIPWWSVLYFSAHHRLLHTGPAYRYVHSWHHRNVNVGPWSGLAMHPAEHLVLFSDVVLLFLLPSHPVHLYFMAMHHGIGAPLSHTGYDAVLLGPQNHRQARFELGDFHHQLHHRFIECNYGGLESPLDEMIGSFHDGTPQGDAALSRSRHERSSTRTTRSDTRGDHGAGAG